jgi:hypothetical protein
MNKFLRWLTGLAGVILCGNFYLLMLYGDTLRSTHLFIVRGTVFYPLAFLNLAAGLILLIYLIIDIIRNR